MAFNFSSIFRRIISFVFLVTWFAIAPDAWGTDFVINSWGDAPTANPAARDGLVTLREAIMAINTQASYGDAAAGESINVIRFAGKISPVITLQAELPVSGWVRIEGGALRPTLSGNDATRIFSVLGGGFLDLRDMTLAQGRAPLGEGGGAVKVIAGNIHIRRTTIRDCFAAHGGGIAAYDYSDISIRESTMLDNFAVDHGGGVAATSGTIVQLLNSTVTGNHANVTGGGIALDHQLLAGEFDFMLQLYCTNSTIVDNRVGFGTWIPGVGGGIGEAGDWPDFWGTTGYKLFNTIVANNARYTANGTAPDDLAARIQSPSHHNLIGAVRNGFDPTITHGDSGNMVGSESSPISPGLGSLALYGGRTLCYRPNAGSPVVNAGNNIWVDGTEALVDVDQRAGVRLKNGTVDIGSVER